MVAGGPAGGWLLIQQNSLFKVAPGAQWGFSFGLLSDRLRALNGLQCHIFCAYVVEHFKKRVCLGVKSFSTLCALSRGLFLGYLSSKTATRAPFAPPIARAPAPPPPATRPGRAAQRLGVVGGVLAHSPDPPPTLRPPSYGQAEAASVERCVFDLRASCRENESGDPLFATRVPGPHLEHNALATWREDVAIAPPTVTLPSAPHTGC